MKRITIRICECGAVVLALLVLPAVWAQQTVDGVYMTPKEVSAFSGETLELANGRFRYWFYTDVAMDRPPHYPLTGTYEMRSNRLVLVHRQIHAPERTVMTIQGQAVLWRNDGLGLWQSERRIHPYAVLIRVWPGPLAEQWPTPPSMRLLYDQAMLDREEKEYRERFNDQPEPVRSLLRAKTQRDDPKLDALRQALLTARQELNPALIEQLVSLLGAGSLHSVSAYGLLEEIYTKKPLTGEEPSFLQSPARRRRALENLINAMSKAKDQSVVEECLLLFLATTKLREVDLALPEAGVRIHLESSPNLKSVKSSSLERPQHLAKNDPMRIIVSACQEWCRDHLELSTRRSTSPPAAKAKGAPPRQ